MKDWKSITREESQPLVMTMVSKFRAVIDFGEFTTHYLKKIAFMSVSLSKYFRLKILKPFCYSPDLDVNDFKLKLKINYFISATALGLHLHDFMHCIAAT